MAELKAEHSYTGVGAQCAGARNAETELEG